MKVKLEILDAAFVYDEEKVNDLNEKELVPKMMMRRRLTRASKIFINLSSLCSFTQGKVVFGSAYGELDVTACIINAIDKNEAISPTAFQNSVYNTAASYHSILHENRAEVITVSSFENTSLDVLKDGALMAMDGQEVFLVAIETINTQGIDAINVCQDYLECGVALRVKMTNKNVDFTMQRDSDKFIPNSLLDMYKVYQGQALENKVIEVTL